jgi:D-arabinan endo alpha-(1,5)-arabinofuranosidase
MYGLRSTWFTIAPTPIMARWYRLGGPRAAIGRPVSGEQAVGGGARQVFRHGRIFWSAATGAHDVPGALLATYRKWGGPRSSLGWPVTGPRVAAHGGHKLLFQRGVIFSRPDIGAHVVYGAILRYWRHHGAASSWIGYPTVNTARTGRGTICRFERAVLTWDKRTNTVRVRKTG